MRNQWGNMCAEYKRTSTANVAVAGNCCGKVVGYAPFRALSLPSTEICGISSSAHHPKHINIIHHDSFTLTDEHHPVEEERHEDDAQEADHDERNVDLGSRVVIP